MKKLNTFLIVFFSFLLISACDEDDNINNNGGDDHGGMKFEAKINGNTWKADSLFSTTNTGAITTTLDISGYGGGEALHLRLTFKKPDVLDTGHYDLQVNPWNHIAYEHAGSIDTTQNGWIKIDSIIYDMPPEYHGRFECTFTDENGQTVYAITEGKFDTNE